jgi:hypothetical protein
VSVVSLGECFSHPSHARVRAYAGLTKTLVHTHHTHLGVCDRTVSPRARRLEYLRRRESSGSQMGPCAFESVPRRANPTDLTPRVLVGELMRLDVWLFTKGMVLNVRVCMVVPRPEASREAW